MKSKHVLLVDDEEHLLVTLRDFLVHEGYEVTLARRAEEALEELRTIEPDIVILDISMPGIGGVGFLRRCNEPDGPSVPILVLTARANMKQFFDGIEVDGFLSKPCSKEDLVSEIERIISAHSAKQSSREQEGKNEQAVVLLGEDDVDLADILKRSMERSGYGVTVVPSGPEMLELAARTQVDIVVIKEVLTGMNGDKVVSLLKAMPSTRNIPALLYGANKTMNMASGSGDHAIVGDASGPDRAIREKDGVSLLACVREILSAKS